MKDEGSEVRRLLSVLRERPHSVDPDRTEARKRRSLPSLQAHVAELARQRARSRRRRAFAFAAAAMVGAFALGAGVHHLQLALAPSPTILAVDGHLTQEGSGERRTFAAGEALPLPVSGDLLTDEDAPATLQTKEGLQLRLEGGSRLALSGMASAGPEHSVALSRGQVGCAVPRLPDGAHFAVVTPNAKVVVHGTRFTVRVDSPAAGVTQTCVRVTEGVVSVHHAMGEATLRAGDEWGCPREPAPSVAPPVPPAPTVAVAETTVSSTVRVASHPAPRSAPERAGGTLAEETALLQAALAAERTGQRSQSSAALLRLLSRYPDSPLAPEARAVLDRVSRPRTFAP